MLLEGEPGMLSIYHDQAEKGMLSLYRANLGGIWLDAARPPSGSGSGQRSLWLHLADEAATIGKHEYRINIFIDFRKMLYYPLRPESALAWCMLSGCFGVGSGSRCGQAAIVQISD